MMMKVLALSGYEHHGKDGQIKITQVLKLLTLVIEVKGMPDVFLKYISLILKMIDSIPRIELLL